MTVIATSNELFEKVCRMEEPVAASSELSRAMLMIVQALEPEEGLAVNRIAMLLHREIEAISEIRKEMFRLTHPSRSYFEREGWPS